MTRDSEVVVEKECEANRSNICVPCLTFDHPGPTKYNNSYFYENTRIGNELLILKYP